MYKKFLKKLSRLTLGFKKSKKTITPSTPINMTTNSNKTLSTIAAHRIEDLFNDFCIYIAKRYDANYDDAICDWNCVGATFRYFGSNIHIQLKVWEHSIGHNNLPDGIIVLSDFVTVAAMPKTKTSSSPSATSSSSAVLATGSNTSQPSPPKSPSPQKSPSPTPSSPA